MALRRTPTRRGGPDDLSPAARLRALAEELHARREEPDPWAEAGVADGGGGEGRSWDQRRPGDERPAGDERPPGADGWSGDDHDLTDIGAGVGRHSATGHPDDVDDRPTETRTSWRQTVSLPSAPAGLRALDVRIPLGAILGLVAVVLVVATVLGVRVWWAQRQAEPTAVSHVAGSDGAGVTGGPVSPPVAPGPASTAVSGAPATHPAGTPPGVATHPSAAPAPPGAVPTAAEVVVHVSGQVQRPGVVRLPPGSRVEDAVRAAGGATKHAALGRINLAALLVDGQQVWVPRPGEDPPQLVAGAPPDSSAGVSPAGPGGVVTPGPSQVPSPPAPVDLNTADQAGLEELPGVGPVTASRILAWRAENGPFTSVDELLEVPGIGERTLEQLRPLVRV